MPSKEKPLGLSLTTQEDFFAAMKEQYALEENVHIVGPEDSFLITFDVIRRAVEQCLRTKENCKQAVEGDRYHPSEHCFGLPYQANTNEVVVEEADRSVLAQSTAFIALDDRGKPISRAGIFRPVENLTLIESRVDKRPQIIEFDVTRYLQSDTGQQFDIWNTGFRNYEKEKNPKISINGHGRGSKFEQMAIDRFRLEQLLKTR